MSNVSWMGGLDVNYAWICGFAFLFISLILFCFVFIFFFLLFSWLWYSAVLVSVWEYAFESGPFSFQLFI